MDLCFGVGIEDGGSVEAVSSIAKAIEANQAAYTRRRAAQEARMAEWRIGHDELVPLVSAKGPAMAEVEAALRARREDRRMLQAAIPDYAVGAGVGWAHLKGQIVELELRL